MANFIYGITAFITLVAVVLIIIATYQLCTHLRQNRKVMIGGREFYAKPPTGYGSETTRDLMGQARIRDLELANSQYQPARFIT